MTVCIVVAHTRALDEHYALLVLSLQSCTQFQLQPNFVISHAASITNIHCRVSSRKKQTHIATYGHTYMHLQILHHTLRYYKELISSLVRSMEMGSNSTVVHVLTSLVVNTSKVLWEQKRQQDFVHIFDSDSPCAHLIIGT